MAPFRFHLEAPFHAKRLNPKVLLNNEPLVHNRIPFLNNIFSTKTSSTSSTWTTW